MEKSIELSHAGIERLVGLNFEVGLPLTTHSSIAIICCVILGFAHQVQDFEPYGGERVCEETSSACWFGFASVPRYEGRFRSVCCEDESTAVAIRLVHWIVQRAAEVGLELSRIVIPAFSRLS